MYGACPFIRLSCWPDLAGSLLYEIPMGTTINAAMIDKPSSVGQPIARAGNKGTRLNRAKSKWPHNHGTVGATQRSHRL